MKPRASCVCGCCDHGYGNEAILADAMQRYAKKLKKAARKLEQYAAYKTRGQR